MDTQQHSSSSRTGPEHYSEAERLLGLINIGSPDERHPGVLAAAQVHATLALAAATAWPAVQNWLHDEDRSAREWSAVTA